MQVETVATDVLVLGAGLAGLRAALAAREAGARVLLAVKGKAGRSGCSAMTTAAYAAVTAEAVEDSIAAHVADTFAGGARVGERALIDLLCAGAPAGVAALEAVGGVFRREGNTYVRSPSGDHSRPRVLVTANNLGTDLTLPLWAAAEAAGVTAAENTMAVALLGGADGIVGALCADLRAGRMLAVTAGATVLATGGAGRMFPITSNPVDVTGDGYAMAFRAGARLRDMEFIQFYPWRCVDPFDKARVPIQPSTFVLGARLYNADGERFMLRFNPEGGEVTTRDVAARGIFEEMRHGRGVGAGVRLDLSPLDAASFERSNPKVARYLRTSGIDHRTYPFIVRPEAHYWMGGLAVGIDGETSLPGLFAAGEVAGGIHGANRINSNALPETQVFGERAGRAAALLAAAAAGGRDGLARAAAASWLARLAGDGPALTEAALTERLQALRATMWDSLGIVRNEDGLAAGGRFVDDLGTELTRARPADARSLRPWVELGFLCDAAAPCLAAALHRRESRGAHWREDFPETDDAAWRGSVMVERRADGSVATTFVPAG